MDYFIPRLSQKFIVSRFRRGFLELIRHRICFNSPEPNNSQSVAGRQQQQRSNGSGGVRNYHRDLVSNRSVQCCEIEDSEVDPRRCMTMPRYVKVIVLAEMLKVVGEGGVPDEEAEETPTNLRKPKEFQWISGE